MASKLNLTTSPCLLFGQLKSTTSHPIVKEIFKAIKKKLPSIGRSTVYRVLKDFTEKGLVQEFFKQNVHYDANLTPHSHLVCEKCKRIFDVFNHNDIVKVKHASHVKYMSNGQLKKTSTKNYQIYFYGLCNKCSKR